MHVQNRKPPSLLASFVVAALLFIGSAGCKTDVQPDACFTTESSQYTIYDKIKFNNCTSEGYSYTWEFDDGSVSTQENPTHQYDEPGKYRVSLKASSENDEFQDYAYKVLEVLEPVVGLWQIDYVKKECRLVDSTVTSEMANSRNNYLKIQREGNYRLNLYNEIDTGEWRYQNNALTLADTTYQVQTIDEQKMELFRTYPADSNCINGIDRTLKLTRQTN